jgi:hypothetical protein
LTICGLGWVTVVALGVGNEGSGKVLLASVGLLGAVTLLVCAGDTGAVTGVGMFDGIVVAGDDGDDVDGVIDCGWAPAGAGLGWNVAGVPIAVEGAGVEDAPSGTEPVGVTEGAEAPGVEGAGVIAGVIAGVDAPGVEGAGVTEDAGAPGVEGAGVVASADVPGIEGAGVIAGDEEAPGVDGAGVELAFNGALV